MKTATLFAAMLAGILTLSGCSEEKKAEAPPAFVLTEAAMGRYCGMNVLEHPGPKGQVILTPTNEAVWFSSARDTLAFTMLPEEPKNIAAIYVSDMAKAPSWEEPGAANWIDARKAFYVIESSAVGGMGVKEAVPFSTREAAEEFASKHGGKIVGFEDMPQDYVLGAADATPPANDPHAQH